VARGRGLLGGAAELGRVRRGASRIGIRLAVWRSRALRDGLLGGSRKWLVIGGLAWFLRLVGFLFFPKPEVVYRAKLKPGETVSFTQHKRPPAHLSKRGRARNT
jgi:hypothetical protein